MIFSPVSQFVYIFDPKMKSMKVKASMAVSGEGEAEICSGFGKS